MRAGVTHVNIPNEDVEQAMRGYLSCIIPVFAGALTILIAHALVGKYGVALAALGMLSATSRASPPNPMA